jgi:hypothetical protein
MGVSRPYRGVPGYPFSSRLSSFRQRQSVPWAIIRWGLLLNHLDLMQAQRIEVHGFLGVNLTPPAIGEVLQRLEDIVETPCVARVPQELGDSVRFKSADVRRVAHGAQHPLGGDRVLPGALAVPRERAAEVPGPRPVHAAVHEHVPDLFCAEFLDVILGGLVGTMFRKAFG